jgi:hypothetical protein
MKIPFFVATGAIFAFEIVMSALRGNGYAVDVVIYINSMLWKYKIILFRLSHYQNTHTIIKIESSTNFYSNVFSWCLLSHQYHLHFLLLLHFIPNFLQTEIFKSNILCWQSSSTEKGISFSLLFMKITSAIDEESNSMATDTDNNMDYYQWDWFALC